MNLLDSGAARIPSRPVTEDCCSTGSSPPASGPRLRPPRLLPGLLRFFGFWAGFTGLYMVSVTACPCCGARTCPVGWTTAAALGAVGSLIILKGRAVIGLLRKARNRAGR